MKDKIIIGSLITLLILGAIAIVGTPIFLGFAGIFYMIGIE